MDEQPKKTGLDLLRVPYAENQIGKLPKPTKKREEMDKLPKESCSICKGYHATSCVIHLDYVGHAAATDRLLDADLHWNWQPLALTPEGLPLLDKDGGLWIKLTVCGETRLGYGDAQGKTGGDAMKERIGDAIRNAGMRFGLALDLWHKGDLHANEIDVGEDVKTGRKELPAKKDPPPPPAKKDPPPTGGLCPAQVSLLKELGEYCKGDESEMNILVGEVSLYTGGKDGIDHWMTLKDVQNVGNSAVPSWVKWYGGALGKLRERVKKEAGAVAINPLIVRIETALTSIHGDNETAKNAMVEGMTGKPDWRAMDDVNLKTLADLMDLRAKGAAP